MTTGVVRRLQHFKNKKKKKVNWGDIFWKRQRWKKIRVRTRQIEKYMGYESSFPHRPPLLVH